MREVIKYYSEDNLSYTIFIKEDGVVLNKRAFMNEEEANQYAEDWVSGKIQFLTE